MSKKYELTKETVTYGKTILHRIKALKDFGDVKKGDLGGWIESKKNLSQEGLCWIHGNSKVYGDARVYDNAEVFIRAEVFGNAEVFGDAKVYGNAKVYDNAEVFGIAKVYDNAEVFGIAKVYGNAEVFGIAEVFGNARVYDNAEVSENAKVYDNAGVFGNANISGDAEIKNPTDYIVIGPIGSRNGHTTFYKTKDNNIRVVCGCFIGTIDEFKARVKETHKGDKYEKVYLNAVALTNHALSLIYEY